MTHRSEPEPPKVPMVDDHPANLLALEATLEPLGATLIQARSGRQALREIERHDFALVLLDVRMGDLDGFETAALIRQHERARETPIIFLSAIHTETHYARQGLSLGAVDYIYKPFDPDLLRDKVRSFLTLYRERRARVSAESALAMKDLILGVLGHDLRSPVTAICATAETLLRDETAPERRVGLIRINASARRMDRMVRALVDYARTYFGGAHPGHAAAPSAWTIFASASSKRSRPPTPDCKIAAEQWSATSRARLGRRSRGAGDRQPGHQRARARRRWRPARRRGRGRADEVTVTVGNEGAFPAALRAGLFEPLQERRRGRARPRARPVHRSRGRRGARRAHRARLGPRRRADALHHLLAATPAPREQTGVPPALAESVGALNTAARGDDDGDVDAGGDRAVRRRHGGRRGLRAAARARRRRHGYRLRGARSGCSSAQVAIKLCPTPPAAPAAARGAGAWPRSAIRRPGRRLRHGQHDAGVEFLVMELVRRRRRCTRRCAKQEASGSPWRIAEAVDVLIGVAEAARSLFTPRASRTVTSSRRNIMLAAGQPHGADGPRPVQARVSRALPTPLAGSPEYMAPEVCIGQRPSRRRSPRRPLRARGHRLRAVHRRSAVPGGDRPVDTF